MTPNPIYLSREEAGAAVVAARNDVQRQGGESQAGAAGHAVVRCLGSLWSLAMRQRMISDVWLD
jgi:hypothetical protein